MYLGFSVLYLCYCYYYWKEMGMLVYMKEKGQHIQAKEMH